KKMGYHEKVLFLGFIYQIIICVECRIQSFGTYKHYEMGFANVELFEHSKLEIQPFFVTEVESAMECADECLMADPKINMCQGFNLYTRDHQATNKSSCELLARHRFTLPSTLFVRKADWMHYQPVTVCANPAPCVIQFKENREVCTESGK
uniref:Apple domain-containing protein n=1 Tax=Clytia hemisphaerica TaxID=252671 RepID=A0A7M5X5Y2_9CNID